MRVQPGRQVQRRVRRVQVARLRGPVGVAGDRDLPELGHQPPGVAAFGAGAGHAVGPDRRRVSPCLGLGAQVEMSLQQRAQHLPAVPVDQVLDLVVRGRAAVRAREQRLERTVALSGLGERPRRRRR